MKRPNSGSSRLALVGGLGVAIVVVAAITGVFVVKSQHAAYVRETLTQLSAAETAYANGQFAEAARVAAGALNRHNTNSTWFGPDEEKRIRGTSFFLDDQLKLWQSAEASLTLHQEDPSKARASLEELLKEARQHEPRSRPLINHVEPLLKNALTQEREKTHAAVALRIPEVRKTYESGSWDALLAGVEEVRTAIAALPDATRTETAKQFEDDLKALESSAAPVASMRAIRDGKETGPVKADRLRDLIRTLPDLKGRDQALHRDLLKAIAEVDPETRKAPAGLALPKENHKSLVEAFTKGSDLREVGKADDRSVVELQGPVHRFSIWIVGQPPQLLIDVDRVRLLFAVPLVDNREVVSLAAAAELSRALRATGHPRVFADEPWVVRSDAPGLCALHVKDKRATVMLGGRLFEGVLADEADANALRTAFRTAARALEPAVRGSDAVPDEIKGPVTAVLKAILTTPAPADHLDSRFCREAVQAGYLEAQLPTIDDAVAARLKEYRRTYDEILKLRPLFEAKSSDGAVVTVLSNLEAKRESLWRVSDPASKTTTFSTMVRDGMGSSLAAVSVFAGVHEAFPESEEPVEVRMSHGTAGVVSRWSAAGGKLEFDPALWAKAVTLGELGPQHEHFVSGDYQVPPHAVKVDGRGQARELILPSGSVRVETFSGESRRDAQERFIQQCAEALRSPGEYHLFYRYFVQYVLDSPVTTATTLIGSSRHCGDAHQDAYQTLDRRLNGKFLADCDDLAELYWTILRRQNRPAFVLGVPGHATCGVAEKEGDGWSFFCVDTGPARGLKGPDLDAIVEKLLRTYDDDRSMSFDPRQMRFLFRFGGEQTRSDYFLDSRILRDPVYADLMIRVQEYWHFGFYALGIETMSKVLETDRMPANCQEIAGLYTRVGLWEDALKWTQAGIDGLESRDHLTGLSESLRVAQCLREMKRKDDAVKALQAAAGKIAEIVKADPKEANRYRPLKFQVASALAQSEHPWEGWDLVSDEVGQLVKSGRAAESLMSMVTGVYSKMREAERSGAPLTERQAETLKKVGEMLRKYHASGLFKSDDSILDQMRKCAQLYGYYLAVEGPKKAAAELAKPEFPAEKSRPTPREGAAPEQDWAWMRLSPYSYAIASARALDKDDQSAGGPPEAIAMIRAMETALPEMRSRASLGPIEFAVLDLRLLRACLEMDENVIRGVFDEMKRQGWGELYENLARTLGATAAYMKVEDFEKVFRIFCDYKVPRRHYYGAVYAASAAEARGHALAASKICIERFPDDADMRREHALLQKLAK